MKTNIILLVALLVSTLTSCVVDVPVPMGSVPHGPIHQQGGFEHPGFNGGHPPGFCGPPPIFHGDQRRHVYGNGPQSYIGGFPPPGGYDPNFAYGMGGYRRR